MRNKYNRKFLDDSLNIIIKLYILIINIILNHVNWFYMYYLFYMYYYFSMREKYDKIIYRVTEIDGRTLVSYSILPKNEKKSYKHKFGNSSFPRYKYFLFKNKDGVL